MANLSKELVNRGHDVELILARSPGKNNYEIDPRIKVTWLHAFSIGKTVVRLARVLKDKNLDVVYTAMPTTNIAVIAARAIAGVSTKVVISERSNPQLEAKHSKTWRYRASFVLQPYVYPYADAIVAVCSDLADSLSSFARLKRETIKVIYNPAYDENEVSLDPSIPYKWLDGNGVPVIVTAGRLMPQKDYSTLLKAFSLVLQQRDARLIILGEGPLRSELEAEAKELGVFEKVHMPGFVPNVIDWFSHANVFALTSIWEGFGNVLVQALAAGCTIVSTDCPNGPREILASGKYGYLVQVGSHVEMSEALIRAIDQPFLSSTLVNRAKDFSAEKSANSYESLFQSLVKG